MMRIDLIADLVVKEAQNRTAGETPPNPVVAVYNVMMEVSALVFEHMRKGEINAKRS